MGVARVAGKESEDVFSARSAAEQNRELGLDSPDGRKVSHWTPLAPSTLTLLQQLEQQQQHHHFLYFRAITEQLIYLSCFFPFLISLQHAPPCAPQPAGSRRSLGLRGLLGFH